MPRVSPGEQFAAGCQAVNSLPRRATFTLSRTLIGYTSEERAFVIFAATLVPIVGGYRYKVV
ncbi:MAG TPA: hypothetical protein VK615_05535 [Candidatus Binatia bacterium]|nr:hypothetical protein [Candidatus Binatia bacterium]